MKSEMEWFDDIAYKKGGSLIRMMQGFLTEPVLKKGLTRYLSRMWVGHLQAYYFNSRCSFSRKTSPQYWLKLFWNRRYKAAVQDDLFSHCNEEGHLAHKLPENATLKQIMSSWTLHSGFPLLRVKHYPRSTNLKVTQEKYVASRATRETTNLKSQKWFIPVSVATTRRPNFDPEPEFWIRDNETTVAITLPENSWIILNAGTTGFYRVLYDDELSSRITEQLMEFPTKIDRFARSQLIDDYFNAAWNSKTSSKTSLICNNNVELWKIF